MAAIGAPAQKLYVGLIRKVEIHHVIIWSKQLETVMFVSIFRFDRTTGRQNISSTYRSYIPYSS